jgi:membrane protein implicated in regulation of membrane protease activity
MHHLLLFLPVLALGLFFWFPWQFALPFYIFILIFSIIAYRKALEAQRQPPVMGRREMIGERAVVIGAEKGKVEVEYKGEIWSAVSTQPLESGQEVIIEKVEGLMLKVGPLPQSSDEGRAES